MKFIEIRTEKTELLVDASRGVIFPRQKRGAILRNIINGSGHVECIACMQRNDSKIITRRSIYENESMMIKYPNGEHPTDIINLRTYSIKKIHHFFTFIHFLEKKKILKSYHPLPLFLLFFTLTLEKQLNFYHFYRTIKLIIYKKFH